jgi:hypothetical protein
MHIVNGTSHKWAFLAGVIAVFWQAIRKITIRNIALQTLVIASAAELL